MAERTAVEPRKRKSRAHRWAFPLGLAIVGLAAVGLATLIVLGAGAVKNITDKGELRIEYELFLTQVVRNGPQYFDDIDTANQTDLLDSAIWSFLKDEGLSKKTYSYSETSPAGFIVPEEDIEPYYRNLFGSESTPAHDTVNGPGYAFTHDPVKKSYFIPLTGVDPIFIPKVYTIDKQGDSTVLIVGYLNSTAWSLNEKGEYVRPAADRFVKITLQYTDDGAKYYVRSIQASEPPDLAEEDLKITTTEQTTAQLFPDPESAPAAESAAETTQETGSTVVDGTTDTAVSETTG